MAQTDNTVLIESRQTFSAWPILFSNAKQPRKDRGGLWYNAESILQPPFEAHKILFAFMAPDPDNPERSKAYQLVVGEVVRWRINPKGLWVRGKFYEPPDDPDHPQTSLMDGLKAEMRKGQIEMTHSSLRNLCSIRADGYVSIYPIQLFNLYEKALFDEIPPGPSA